MSGLAQPVLAGLVDDVKEAIFEDGTANIKAEYRACSGDGECTAVLSLCRWRPVNKASQKQVSDISATVKLECKWPPPPANAPVARCVNRLCAIPPDGKYY